ncbi:hypothetical protein COB57_00345 [Candidatus Peregrinibacteria bacterium]|nr:MAG: hypothetical protein COB57_00345 [Candidatus Peregrinibacteria bacterium]
MTSYFLIIQAIGGLALLLTIISFQQKNRNSIIKIQIFSSILYSLHFFLLNALSGSIMNFIGIFRGYVFHKKTEKKWAKNPLWLYVFMTIIIIATVITWQSPISLLPMTASLIGTYAYWQTDAKKVRWMSLCSSPLWMIYNIAVLSIPGIISEIFIASSTIIGMYRFDVKRK